VIIRQKTGTKYPVHKSRPIVSTVLPLAGDKSYNSLGTLVSTGPTGTVEVLRKTESIVYTGGMPGHTRQGCNFCQHTKYTRRYLGDTGGPAQINTLPPGGLARTEYFSTHKTLAESRHTLAESDFRTATALQLGPSLLNNNALGWINQAVLDLKPDLKKFSLPNDIIDWRQMGKLVTMWNRTHSLVTNLARQHIGYKFGVKPLAGDMLGLLDGMLGLKDELTKFRRKQGRIISARKCVLNDRGDKLGHTDFLPYARTNYVGQVARKVDAYMVYKPLPVLALGNIDLTLRSLLTITGVELNPAILWDAIPFSFVVDWFGNVGNFLEQYRHEALELPIMVMLTYLQYHETVTTTSWTNFFSDGAQTVKPGQTASTWSEQTFFHRLPMNPDYATLAGLKSKWPSANQALLGVSLGAVLGGHKVNTFFREVNSVTGRQLRAYSYGTSNLVVERLF
jgi:hypothetical protein